MEALLDVEQLRASDAWAIEDRGIPGLDLMERAAEGLAEVVGAVAPRGRVVVVCGGGNNGGDGYAVARLLRGVGREVDVAWTSDPDSLKGDARANAQRLGGEGVARFEAGVLQGAAVVVDAILGTGFSGTPREDVAAAIEAINDSGVDVVACDVPSGVDASTGVVAGAAVRAVATATFHAAMPGLWIAPGKQHAGEVRVVDIGIPRDGYPIEPHAWLTDRDILDTYVRRGAASTKFASGHVLVAGGSRGLTGAPCLASLAAMRAGAGYVTACVPSALNDIFEIKLTEVMSVPLPDDGAGGHIAAGADGVLEKAQRGGALVAGPGLGRTDGAFAFAQRLAQEAEVALVLDADGLNAHAGRLETLARRTAPTILTPHAGELARLLETDSKAVERERLRHAREAAAAAGAIVVLKGDDTIVASPDGRVGISRGDAPALATAGTGDVLSGVLGAFLARGMAPFEAACGAVFTHATAGRRAATARNGPDGVIAGDVVEELPQALE
jgi:NAD(P)H-hydrate epimerase